MSGAFRDPVGPAPEFRSPRLLWLLFAAAAAPLAWAAQTMLAYGVSAAVCYPADHPVYPGETSGLRVALLLFDLVAILLCLAGGLVSWRIWRRLQAGEGRNRFLALWGIMSGLWFAAAILFNIFASVLVPLCRG